MAHTRLIEGLRLQWRGGVDVNLVLVVLLLDGRTHHSRQTNEWRHARPISFIFGASLLLFLGHVFHLPLIVAITLLCTCFLRFRLLVSPVRFFVSGAKPDAWCNHVRSQNMPMSMHAHAQSGRHPFDNQVNYPACSHHNRPKNSAPILVMPQSHSSSQGWCSTFADSQALLSRGMSWAMRTQTRDNPFKKKRLGKYLRVWLTHVFALSV